MMHLLPIRAYYQSTFRLSFKCWHRSVMVFLLTVGAFVGLKAQFAGDTVMWVLKVDVQQYGGKADTITTSDSMLILAIPKEQLANFELSAGLENFNDEIQISESGNRLLFPTATKSNGDEEPNFNLNSRSEIVPNLKDTTLQSLRQYVDTKVLTSVEAKIQEVKSSYRLYLAGIGILSALLFFGLGWFIKSRVTKKIDTGPPTQNNLKPSDIATRDTADPLNEPSATPLFSPVFPVTILPKASEKTESWNWNTFANELSDIRDRIIEVEKNCGEDTELKTKLQSITKSSALETEAIQYGIFHFLDAKNDASPSKERIVGSLLFSSKAQRQFAELFRLVAYADLPGVENYYRARAFEIAKLKNIKQLLDDALLRYFNCEFIHPPLGKPLTTKGWTVNHAGFIPIRQIDGGSLWDIIADDINKGAVIDFASLELKLQEDLTYETFGGVNKVLPADSSGGPESYEVRVK